MQPENQMGAPQIAPNQLPQMPVPTVEYPIQNEHLSSTNQHQEHGQLSTKGLTFNGVESVPVVKVWSVRGVEYAIMSFMLWALAIALTWVIVSLINGQTGFVNLSGALSLMIVSLPIFGFFFLRLKKAELANPDLRIESTKRRFSQITQIVSFFVIFFASLGLVSSLISATSGETDGLGRTVGTALVFIVVWGALFAYYWFDEHRQVK